MTMSERARFSVGELIHHKLFDYRGVVVDVDPHFMLTEEWYQNVAGSRPPKDKPWYHVLVHDATHNTYVAERNLEPDTSAEPIRHPLVDLRFTSFENGRYLTSRKAN
jgi:heat shock protein HspQ